MYFAYKDSRDRDWVHGTAYVSRVERERVTATRRVGGLELEFDGPQYLL